MTDPTPEYFFHTANVLQDVASRDKPPADVQAALSDSEKILIDALKFYATKEHWMSNSENGNPFTLCSLKHALDYAGWVHAHGQLQRWAIAKHGEDIGVTQLTKPQENVAQPEAAKVALDALKAVEIELNTTYCGLPLKDYGMTAYGNFSKNIETIRAALQTRASDGVQQPDAELLEALMDARMSMLDSGYNPHSVIIKKCNQAISRATQIRADLTAKQQPDADLGTAVQAIQFAITIDDHYDRLEFLECWNCGDLSEWDDFKSFIRAEQKGGDNV